MGKILIHNAGQLLTCAAPGGCKRRDEMRELGIIEDGAVYMEDGVIRGVGTSSEILGSVPDMPDVHRINAGSRVVMPGLIDSHTHIVHAGSRLDEFEMRVAGAEYMDILKAGGGILASREALRKASIEELVDASRKRIAKSISFGVTTIEAKSGYGLDTENELKQLRAIKNLQEIMPVDIIPTFLGAHAVPE